MTLPCYTRTNTHFSHSDPRKLVQAGGENVGKVSVNSGRWMSGTDTSLDSNMKRLAHTHTRTLSNGGDLNHHGKTRQRVRERQSCAEGSPGCVEIWLWERLDRITANTRAAEHDPQRILRNITLLESNKQLNTEL